MEYYKCQVCGYIYRPQAGDKAHGVPENTKFEDLGPDWKCPTCNHPKGVFEEYDPDQEREIYIF